MTREEAKEFIAQSVKNDVDMALVADAIKALEQEPTTKNDLGVDWEELKSKIFMEVDGGTDDNWLRYGEVCDRISNSIDDFKANLPSVTPQEPINSVLEDIKAEIEITMKYQYAIGEEQYAEGFEKCLEIIDNHISGKENT